MVIISDTTTLSTLAQMNDLWILEQQFTEIAIPQPVFEELKQLSQFDFDISIFSKAKWLKVQSVSESPVLNLLLTLVDIGEAHAIALAVEKKADLLIIDEKKGRNIAKSMNLNFTGLGGILIRAKAAGLISDVKTYLQKAEKEAGFYLSQSAKEMILKAASEG